MINKYQYKIFWFVFLLIFLVFIIGCAQQKTIFPERKLDENFSNDMTEENKKSFSQEICKNECPNEGFKGCFENGFRTCGNYDADSCLEWTTTTSCEKEKICNLGRCVNNININSNQIVWKQTNGPEGGDFRTITMNPSDENELLTGNGKNLYQSTNKGENWKLVKSFPTSFVMNIIYNPDDSRIIYVSTENNGIFKSEDGGETWKAANNGINDISVIELAMDSVNPEVLYAGTYTGIYRTQDGGNQWEDVSAGLPDEKITSIGLVTSDVAYVGVGGSMMGEVGSLFHTTNGGEEWNKVEIGQSEETFISSILVNPNNNNEILVGLGDSYNRMNTGNIVVYKTTNRGVTWKPYQVTNMMDCFINLLGYSKKNDKIVFMASGGNLYKSIDGGESWRRLFGGPFDPICIELSCMDFSDIELNPSDEDIIFLPLSGAGIAKSTDGGNTWEHINNGLNGRTTANLVVDQKDPETVYAAGAPSATGCPGMFKTTDGGETWKMLDKGGIYHSFTDELYIHPNEPDTIFNIADVGILFKSTDGGENWKAQFDPHHGQDHPFPPRTNFEFSSIYAIEIAPSNPNVLYAIKNGFGIFKSEDKGESWQYQIFSPDYSYSVAVEPDNPDIVYSGYHRKVFESGSKIFKQEGGSWKEIFDIAGSVAVKSIEIDPNNYNRIYAGVTGKEGRIYVSDDKGKNWRILNNDLTFTTIWGHSQLQINPLDKNTVYAGTWGGGTYKTTNGGKEWVLLDEEYTFSPTCLSVYEKNPDIIYVCDRLLPKIHKSTDGGDTWEEFYDFGDKYMLTSAILIDPDDPSQIIVAAFKPPMAHDGSLFRIKDGVKTDIGKDLPRSVIEIEIDPKNKDILYITTHIHGVYKSDDGGLTWDKLDDKNGLPRIGFYDIDVDPSDSNTLYATALCGVLPDYMLPPKIIQIIGGVENLDANGKCGVYKSTDGGNIWVLILETKSEARGVDIDPVNNNNLYVADMVGGVWVSNDAGNTWRQENNGLGSTSMTSVKIKGDYIYASTQGSGVYAGIINDDGSITWDKSRSNKPIAEVSNLQIEVDPSNSKRIYISSYPGGLLRSDDGGLHWNDKNFLTPSIKVEDPSIQGYYSFAIDSSDSGIVWLGVYGKGVFISHDGMDYNMFANGEKEEMVGKRITKVIINPRHPEEIFVSGEDGVFTTKDKGRTWASLDKGLPTKDVFTLAISSDGELYAGTRGYGVFSFNRATKSWTQKRSLSNFGSFWSTWERPLYQYSDMIIDPNNPNNIYLASFPTGMFKSIDGGLTWTESNIGFIDEGSDGIFSITFHPYNGSIIYAGTYNGVSVSYDGARHWERLSKGIPSEQWPFSIAIDPTNPKIMYAATKNGKDKGFCDRHSDTFCGTVVKTVDGGKNWFEITNGLDLRNEYYSIIIHPRNNKILFVSASPGFPNSELQTGGVFMSNDAGETWLPINNGLRNLWAGSENNVAVNLGIDGEGNYLYFGTRGSGVWRADLS